MNTAPHPIIVFDAQCVLCSANARFPRGLRDPLYRWVARNRYRPFGRRETCWVPSAPDAARFL